MKSIQQLQEQYEESGRPVMYNRQRRHNGYGKQEVRT